MSNARASPAVRWDAARVLRGLGAGKRLVVEGFFAYNFKADLHHFLRTSGNFEKFGSRTSEVYEDEKSTLGGRCHARIGIVLRMFEE
jgi:hypothetical protein